MLNRYNDNKGKLGNQGEKVLRVWLKKQGYLILPASLIQDDGAPMLTGEQVKAILPNNLTWKTGQPGWVEVKTKSNATLHLKPPKRWEHGMPLRHWDAYQKVQEVTHVPVDIAVLELSTKLILLASLDELDKSRRVFRMDGEMHIFVARDIFVQYPINLSLPEPIPPLAERTKKQHLPPTNQQGKMF